MGGLGGGIGQGYGGQGTAAGRSAGGRDLAPGAAGAAGAVGPRRFRAGLLQAPLAIGLELPDLGPGGLAAQQLVHRGGHIPMHQPAVAAVHFHRLGERRFRRPFQHGFLGAAAARLLIAQRDRLDAANEVAEGGVFDQIGQGIAVGCGHQHHAPLGDRAGRHRFGGGADFIDDDHLGHVVFDGLDHHLMLQFRLGHLHAPRPADGRMGDVTITGDLIAGVDHHHAPAQLIGQHPGDLPQGCGFSNPGRAHQQQGFAAVQQVAHHGHRAEHGPSHPAGEAHHLAPPVAQGADAMQGALYASAVVTTEGAQALQHSGQVGPFDRHGCQRHGPGGVAGLRHPAQIEHHLQQLVAAFRRLQGLPHRRRQHLQELFQLGVFVLGCPLLGRRGWAVKAERRRGVAAGGEAGQGDRIRWDGCAAIVLNLPPKAARLTLMADSRQRAAFGGVSRAKPGGLAQSSSARGRQRRAREPPISTTILRRGSRRVRASNEASSALEST